MVRTTIEEVAESSIIAVRWDAILIENNVCEKREEQHRIVRGIKGSKEGDKQGSHDGNKAMPRTVIKINNIYRGNSRFKDR